MRLKYDDIVLQTVARLLQIIPQGSPAAPPTPAVPKVAAISIMSNPQKAIADFFKGQEISQIMVTYSGNQAEGGRDLADFFRVNSEVAQKMAHTVEVHICANKYMNNGIGGPQNTILGLMWLVGVALIGLRFYRRDDSGNILSGEQNAQTGGMFLIESFVDRNEDGGVVVSCRFQVMEMVSQDVVLSAEQIWGTYQQITFQEYSQANGDSPNVGQPLFNIDGGPLLNLDNSIIVNPPPNDVAIVT